MIAGGRAGLQGLATPRPAAWAQDITGIRTVRKAAGRKPVSK